jgi:site-specific DNA-cytosine methylase
MGLASVLTPELKQRARIALVAEIDRAYLDTIALNYDYFATHIGSRDQLPAAQIEPIDLTTRSSMNTLKSIISQAGEVALLLAGPPCQGFSTSNRMSRNLANPMNAIALRTIDAVRATQPKIAIIENVPGIQTIESSSLAGHTVADHITVALRRSGYGVSTVLLNAADFGVPQHRMRSFTIAVHRSIGEYFDLSNLAPNPTHGPGTGRAYRTVREAFSDLPSIRNGETELSVRYPGPAESNLQRELRRFSHAIYDHVTTKHSRLVLGRFRSIPAGNNWRAIRSRLTNYAEPNNTHNNIYQRLDPAKPSRTIGNFRKAMTIHPWEHRGLSIREAARLQTLPDWMRFFHDGNEIYRGGVLKGLGIRQQQVGNAVCFRLTSTLISHLFANA